MKDRIISVLVLFTIVGLYFLYVDYRKKSEESHLSKHIKWLSSQSVYDLIRIVESSYRSTLSSYDFNEDELKYVAFILNEYRKYMANKFLNDQLLSSKWFASMSDKDYFLVTLFPYLVNNSCEMKFQDYYMYKRISTVDHYGYYESLNRLTDFGVAFYKLLFIVSCYCESDTEIREYFGTSTAEYTKSVLDSKILSLTHN